MNKPSINIPFYRQMIDLLRYAFSSIDQEGRAEVIQFVLTQQHADGGFQDRGGRSDLYYSLFGMMILRAIDSPLNQTKEGDEEESKNVSDAIEKLRQFISQQKNFILPGFIEKCCLVLLQKEFSTGWVLRVKSLLSLGRSFWKERHSINLSYRSFVLFLTLNAVFPFPEILKLGAKKMLSRTIIDENSPCSEIAAKVFLHRMMNHNGTEEQELLNSFFCESGGFKAFSHLQQADMLSTSVALFALNFSGYDLRMFKPTCFDFMQQNFSEGAFLSGDGDQTADVEYTFYGLLALGVLVD